LSIISRWLEDSFNEAATGIAKKIAPLVGADKTQIDQSFQQNKPLDVLTSAAGKAGKKVLSAPVVGSVLKGAFRGVAPVLKGAYVVYEEGYRRPLTTALLLGTNIPKYSDESQGTFRSLKDLQDAYQDTANVPEEDIKGIGLTQTIAEVTGRPFRKIIQSSEEILNPEQYDATVKNVEKYVPWASPNFDITDPKARKEIFEETWSGSLFTGGLSLLQIWAEGAGAAKLVTLTATKTGVVQTAREAKDALKIQGTDSVNWIDNGAQGPFPNGIAVHYKNAVDNTSETIIRETNPLVYELPVEMQGRAAFLYANAKTAKEVDLIARSHFGDVQAFDELWKVKASAADALNDFGMYEKQYGPLAPITDFDRATKIAAVVKDLEKTNPQLAKITESWAVDLGRGIGFTDWAPSKFATIEQARKARADLRFGRRYGNVIQANKLDANMQVTTIQENRFTRAIHVIQNLFNEAPRYYINYSDPRGIADTAVEIVSEIGRVKYLRGTPKLQEYTAAYANAASDTQRKLILEGIEEDVIKSIGNNYSLPEDVAIRLYQDFKTNRSNAQGSMARDNAMELPDTSVMIADPWVRSQLADTHILLDFKLFDRALREYVRKNKDIQKASPGFLGTTGEIFDYMNSVFSHAVLIRPGYIPKNAIVEPMMRMIAIGDAAAMANDILPATKNFVINNVNRGRLTADIVLDTVKGKTPSRYRKRIAASQEDKALNINLLKEVDKQIKDIDNQIKDFEVKQMTTGFNDLDEFNLDLIKDKKDDLIAKQNLHKETIDNLDQNIAQYFDDLLFEQQTRDKLKIRRTVANEDRKFTTKTGTVVLPGPQAVGAKGGLAMRSEIDPSAAALQQANLSYGMNRYNAFAKQTEITKIKPGEPNYFSSMSKELNVNAKNDELVKMWAAGISRKDALAWLNGDKDIVVGSETIGKASGTNYHKLILEVNPEYRMHSFETQFVNDVYNRYDFLIPDADLKPQFMARDVTARELEARYALRDDLPVLEGNRSIYAASKWQKVQAATASLSRLGFQAITAPERILFRNPFFARKWDESIRRQIQQAEEFGVEVTSDLVNDRFRFIANSEALKAVEQTFYTVRRLNNLNYALRFFTGFPTALINSYKFWAKSIAKNPYNAVLQYKFQNLPYESPKIFDILPGDVYDADIVVDQDGNKIGKDTPRKEGEQRYLILGKPAWSNKSDLEPYTKKVDVDQWNFLLGAPSASWLGSINISNLVSTRPEWEKAFKKYLGESIYNKILYGGRPAQGEGLGGKTLGVFTPGYFDAVLPLLKQSLNAAFDESFQDEAAFAQRYWINHSTAMVNWASQGYPKDQEPKEKDIRRQTYWDMTQIAAEKWLAPLGISNQPVSQIIRDQRQILIKRYRTGELPLPAGKTAVQAATEAMNDIWGVDINRFFVSSYKKQSSLEPSQEAYQTFKKHKSLVNKVARIDPMMIGIVTNPDTPGDYSPAVGSWMQSAFAGNKPLSGAKKTAEESKAEFELRTGWAEYIKVKNKYDALLAQSGAKSYGKNPALKQKLEDEKQEIGRKYPAWFNEYGPGGGAASTNRALKVIVAALTDESYMNYSKDSRKWQTITAWFLEREKVIQTIKANQRNKSFVKQIKDQWADRQQDYINADIAFAELHAQYLDNDNLANGLDILTSSLENQ
jgi:hypothetical protein